MSSAHPIKSRQMPFATPQRYETRLRRIAALYVPVLRRLSDHHSLRAAGINRATNYPAANSTQQHCHRHNQQPDRSPPPRFRSNRVVFDRGT